MTIIKTSSTAYLFRYSNMPFSIVSDGFLNIYATIHQFHYYIYIYYPISYCIVGHNSYLLFLNVVFVLHVSLFPVTRNRSVGST